MKTTLTAADAETGIAIRFIRAWDPKLLLEDTPQDRAFALAMADERDVPFMLKLATALQYVRSMH